MAIGSSSKVALYRRCLKKAYYNDMLKLQRNIPSIAPSRGTILHKCLQNYYEGKDWTEPINDLRLDLDKVFEEERAEWANLPDELYRIMKGYLLNYRASDSRLKTLATEYQFDIPVGTHQYKGTIDWVYQEENGDIWIADHKTVKIIPALENLYMDLQTALYYYVAKQGVIPGVDPDKVRGIVFNHIKTKPPTRPQLLKKGGLSKSFIDTDIASYFAEVKAQGLNPEDYKEMIDKLKDNVFFRRVKFPVTQKTLDILKLELETTLDQISNLTHTFNTYGKDCAYMFPRNMMKNRCEWDCEYSKLCFSELSGANVQGIIDNDYEAKELRYDDEESE